MTYSKEPWKLTMDMILDATESVVAAQRGPSGLTKEDMQRIVLCVNACKGVSNESLAKGHVALVGTTNTVYWAAPGQWIGPNTTITNKKGTP